MSATKRIAIFLDRDGILNHSVIKNGRPYPPSCVDEVEIPVGVADALMKLKNLGILLIGVTNQPDVVRGTTTKEAVVAINDYLKAKLSLDEIFVCFHDDADGCACRKPKAGLILDAAARYSVNVAASYMVGDRWKDVEAGRRAGCNTVWVDYAYAEDFKTDLPDYVSRTPADAFQWILTKEEINHERTD